MAMRSKWHSFEMGACRLQPLGREMLDAVTFLEEGQGRIEALLDHYFFDPKTDAETAEPLLAVVLLELHVQVTIEEEIFLPAVDAIAQELGTSEAKRVRADLARLQHDLVSFCAAQLRGDATESSMRDLFRSTIRHIQDQRRLSFPVVRRWLDPEVRGELGHLLQTRRQALESEIHEALG